ncbi:HAD-IA family hydrolase [Paenibacillus sp. y28]|uniref:HAD-IA family hydrolase n=1 Tax=Paenibacillus sp. y28 TaxID=3129110 RepID=UPI00301AE94A
MNPLTRKYKAVFFDAGDTLLTVPAAREVLQRFLSERSIEIDVNEIGAIFEDAFRKLYYDKPLDQFEACTPETDRAFWASLYAFILQHLGAYERVDENVIHQWCHELYDLYTAPEQYSLFEDVREVLEGLQARGFRLGLISNFAPTLRHILEQKGILHYFDPVIVSTEVGLEKPNPAIFTLALEQAGLQADEVLYIGDHDKNDLWAPAQVGIAAVKIKRYDYHTGEGIHSLRELLEQLA